MNDLVHHDWVSAVMYISIVLSQYSKRHSLRGWESKYRRKGIQCTYNSAHLYETIFYTVYSTQHSVLLDNVCYFKYSNAHVRCMNRANDASLFFDIDAVGFLVRACECSLLNFSKRPHEANQTFWMHNKNANNNSNTDEWLPKWVGGHDQACWAHTHILHII